jgi:hypothetical protein
MHLHSITGTRSTKDNGVERHNQSVSNFDEKANDSNIRFAINYRYYLHYYIQNYLKGTQRFFIKITN